MINLLPIDDRRQLQAARTNVLLLRYSIGLVLAAVFLGLATIAFYVVLTSMKQSAENVISKNQARVANYSTVQAQADAYKGYLSTAQGIFSQDVNYAKLYLGIARLMPANTALESLTLDGTTLGTPMEIPVKIKGEQQATALVESFRSSPIFNNTASYGTLSMNTGDDKATYPYILTVKVTVNKGALK